MPSLGAAIVFFAGQRPAISMGSPLGADGKGWLRARGGKPEGLEPARSRRTRSGGAVPNCAGGASRERTDIGFRLGGIAAKLPVRRGARHNGGYANPKGAKRCRHQASLAGDWRHFA